MPLARNPCVCLRPLGFLVCQIVFATPFSVETLYNKEAEGPDWTDFAFPLWNSGRAGGWDRCKKIE